MNDTEKDAMPECPSNPFGHDFRGGTACICGATRTATEAVLSILSSGMRSGVGPVKARALLDRAIAESKEV